MNVATLTSYRREFMLSSLEVTKACVRDFAESSGKDSAHDVIICELHGGNNQ